MADFSAGEILTLRSVVWLGDYADTTGAGTYTSKFNLAYKRNWISDAQLNTLKARVERDYARELESLYDEHDATRQAEGDDAATAATSAAAQKLDAVMKLVMAEVREGQMNDSGWLSTIEDSTVRQQIIDGWSRQIIAARNFLRQRSGAPFSAVQLERG